MKQKMKANYYYDSKIEKVGEKYWVNVYMSAFGKSKLMGGICGDTYQEALQNTKGVISNLYKMYPRVSLFEFIVESIKEKCL